MTTRTVIGPITHEAGNMSEWTSSATVDANTTGAITGTYSARGGHGLAENGEAIKNYTSDPLGGRCKRFVIRAKYRPRSTPSGGDPALLFPNANCGVILRDDATGKLACGGGNFWDTAPTNGTSYQLEMEVTFSGRDGAARAKLFVDGVLKAQDNDLTSIAGTWNDSLKVLNVTGGKTTWDEVLDDIEVLSMDSWN